MSDHEFEKQVQRKMDELKLRPSHAVWTAVEKNIRQTKPRRRLVFWLPVFFVFLATTGYLLYSGNSPFNQSPSIAESKSTIETNDHSSTNTITHKENNSTRTTTTDKPTTQNNSPVNGAHPDQQQEQGTRSQHLNEQPVQPIQGNAHETVPDNENRPKVNRHSNAVHVPYAKGIKKNKNNTSRLPQDIVPVYNTPQIAPGVEEAPFFAMPQLAPDENADIATGKAAPAPLDKRSIKLTIPEDAAAKPIQKQRGPKWVWGAQANVGFSRISQSNLFQVDGWLSSTEKSQAEDLSMRNDNGGMLNSPGFSYNSFINTAPPPQRKPAVIRQGLSYNVGLYAQRPLSKRLRLTIGLQYAYMSAHTDIGKMVERPTIVNMGTASANVVTRYYTSYDAVTSAGLGAQWQGPPDSLVLHKYTYRFHNIEIPVTVNWQINKGRQLPPFVLDAGLSISQLLSADALHYDGTKGIYYEDNDLLNKTFVNAVLGLNVGLFQQSKTPVWIGPNLRYSLTGLVDKSVSRGQFMWSAGINARIQLSR